MPCSTALHKVEIEGNAIEIRGLVESLLREGGELCEFHPTIVSSKVNP